MVWLPGPAPPGAAGVLTLPTLLVPPRAGCLDPHRQALLVSSRQRNMEAASYAHSMAGRLKAGAAPLSQREYAALLYSQYFVHRDVAQVQATLDAMQRQGVPLDPCLSQHMLQLFCESRLWDQALALLTDILDQQQQQPPPPRRLEQRGQGPAHDGPVEPSGRSSGGGWHPDSAWHIVWRNARHLHAPDDVASTFAARMEPKQRQRFMSMYAIRRKADGSWSLSAPAEDELLGEAEQLGSSQQAGQLGGSQQAEQLGGSQSLEGEPGGDGEEEAAAAC
jgi:hypothetical protein